LKYVECNSKLFGFKFNTNKKRNGIQIGANDIENVHVNIYDVEKKTLKKHKLKKKTPFFIFLYLKID
jgi:hypothetical protein